MCYAPDGTARFVCLKTFQGSITGRRGGLVLETTGEFNGELARGRWTVMEGSGTGELARLTGDGRFEAPHGSYRLG
jgi:hypothetical protein